MNKKGLDGEKGFILDFIRFKVYGKTVERTTSTGVIETSPRDPLSSLLLTSNQLKYKHNRKLLHNKGKVISRLEFSFYGSNLMKL